MCAGRRACSTCMLVGNQEHVLMSLLACTATVAVQYNNSPEVQLQGYATHRNPEPPESLILTYSKPCPPAEVMNCSRVPAAEIGAKATSIAEFLADFGASEEQVDGVVIGGSVHGSNGTLHQRHHLHNTSKPGWC